MLRCTLLSWVLADAVTPRLPCLASYTESCHPGFSGGVLWELGMHGQYIAETHSRLTSTITTRTEGRARTRSQIKLARLIMATGDPSKPPPSAPRPWTGQLPSAAIDGELLLSQAPGRSSSSWRR
jgi:hypothetical protein